MKVVRNYQMLWRKTVIDSMYYSYFSDIDDNSGEWGEIYYEMFKYIEMKYGDKIKEYYHINCGDQYELTRTNKQD